MNLSSFGFPAGSDGKESSCDAGDPSLIPGLGRSPREGNGNPTPVFLPGESQGQRSLAATVWGCKESDTTEQVTHTNIYAERNSDTLKLMWKADGCSCV